MSLISCKKEGRGGDASIRGYVQAQKFNSTFTQFTGEYPARDIDVFIVYGDNMYGYDDRIHTDYQGRFEFPFLYEGNYRIYCYSRDSTRQDPSGTVPVIRDVVIQKRKEIVDMDTLIVFQ